MSNNQPKKSNKGQNAPNKKSKAKASMPKRIRQVPLASSAPVVKRDPRRIYRNSVMSSNGDSLRVRACEPMFTVRSKVNFQSLLDEYINPMNNKLFPVLSQEAALYDKWRPYYLRLIYEPRCPTSTTGQVGVLILPDDEVSEAPVSMVQLEFYRYGISTASWTPCSTEYKMGKDALNWYFTAANSEFDSSTIGSRRTMSTGTIQVYASDSSADNTLSGVVYIEYDIEFCERRPPLAGGGAFNAPSVTLTNASAASAFDLNPIKLSLLYGELRNNLTSNTANLTSNSNSGLASYTAQTAGNIVPLSAAIAVMSGLSRYSQEFFLSAPSSGGSVAPKGLVRQVTEDYVSLGSPRESVVGYYQVEAKADGSFWAQDIPNGPWYDITGKNVEEKKVGAVNDYSCQILLYNPAANTTTILRGFYYTNAASVIHQTIDSITNSSDNALYIIPYVTAVTTTTRQASIVGQLSFLETRS